MKKIIIVSVGAVVLLLASLLFIENSFADEKIDFVIDNQNIEYSVSQLYFFNTEHDEYDAAADIPDTDFKVVAAEESNSVCLKLKHKPLRLYELTGEREKVSFNEEKGCYTLSSLRESDSEECEYDVVADYGIRKNVYSFFVLNKTYIEKQYNISPDNRQFEVSEYSSLPTEDVTVIPNKNLNYCYEMGIGFSIKNNTGSSVECLDCLLEKNINGSWYAVEQLEDVKDKSRRFENYEDPFPIKVESGSSADYELPCALSAYYNFFDSPALIISGIYRFVVPYTSGGESRTALSRQFTVGYVPEK